jgi:hypothetical protein
MLCEAKELNDALPASYRLEGDGEEAATTDHVQ